MKVSIITATYNSANTVLDTLASVRNQTYSNIEHILVDGYSTDDTIALVEQHRQQLAAVISEPDDGAYHAMNKGIRMATGDIIGILNSDDYFAGPQVLEKVVMAFQQMGVDSVYGDLEYVDAQNTSRVIRYWRAGSFERKQFLNGWMLPHPTFFVKRGIYEKFGIYNSRFTCAADYELMLRFLYKMGISTHYIPEVLVRMRTGGLSNASVRNRLVANREDREAWRINGLQPRFFTTFLKPIRKISQFITV